MKHHRTWSMFYCIRTVHSFNDIYRHNRVLLTRCTTKLLCGCCVCVCELMICVRARLIFNENPIKFFYKWFDLIIKSFEYYWKKKMEKYKNNKWYRVKIFAAFIIKEIVWCLFINSAIQFYLVYRKCQIIVYNSY